MTVIHSEMKCVCSGNFVTYKVLTNASKFWPKSKVFKDFKLKGFAKAKVAIPEQMIRIIQTGIIT